MTLTDCFLVVTATSSNVYEVDGGFVTTGVEAHYPWTNRWAGMWLTCGERASSSARSVAACMQLYSSRRKRRGRGRDADSVLEVRICTRAFPIPIPTLLSMVPMRQGLFSGYTTEVVKL